MKKISIIHPSYNRPQWAAETAKKWLSQVDKPEGLEYILSIDEKDPAKDWYLQAFYEIPEVEVIINPNQNMIEAANHGARLSTGDILILVSDDFDCFPLWDRWIRNVTRGREDWTLKVPDGYRVNYYLQTLPIMDRTYYNRFGYIYNPIYTHMWSDTEASTVGYMLGKMLVVPDGEDVPIFKHNHYTAGLSPKDHVYEKNDSSMDSGRQIFFDRFARDFDLNFDEIVIKIPIEIFQ